MTLIMTSGNGVTEDGSMMQFANGGVSKQQGGFNANVQPGGEGTWGGEETVELDEGQVIVVVKGPATLTVQEGSTVAWLSINPMPQL